MTRGVRKLVGYALRCPAVQVSLHLGSPQRRHYFDVLAVRVPQSGLRVRQLAAVRRELALVAVREAGYVDMGLHPIVTAQSRGPVRPLRQIAGDAYS